MPARSRNSSSRSRASRCRWASFALSLSVHSRDTEELFYKHPEPCRREPRRAQPNGRISNPEDLRGKFPGSQSRTRRLAGGRPQPLREAKDRSWSPLTARHKKLVVPGACHSDQLASRVLACFPVPSPDTRRRARTLLRVSAYPGKACGIERPPTIVLSRGEESAGAQWLPGFGSADHPAFRMVCLLCTALQAHLP
jgi:hypothetical protein